MENSRPSYANQLFDRIYDFRRKYFGRYELLDPRPNAKSAPYTYYLPSRAELDEIRSGDLVRLIFRSIPSSRKWGGERMWVTVKSVSNPHLRGTLDNHPADMPQLAAGATIEFEQFHVIDIDYQHEVDRDGLREPKRWYWDRCMVDDCVLNEGVKVGYLYREEPDPDLKGDEFSDSGWRIRGDLRGETDEEIEARKASFVAMGAVLNRDDSWLSLIDEPVGAAFLRDFESGVYVREE